MRAVQGAADFAGLWQVERIITDRLSGQAGRFSGQAMFARAKNGLDYTEQGLLQMGDGPLLTATRSYRWQFGGPRVAVNFTDGRAFHDFALGVSGPGSDHLCGADLYRVRYDWDHWPLWHVAWDVRGPRKDYLMESRYGRH